MRWAIFCRVIDNYGDAGVCWRLAADLNHRGEAVTLYIDDPEVLGTLLDPDPRTDTVLIKPWPADTAHFTAADVADVVIEAFACDPPTAYVAAMAARATAGKPSAWINLEYLSAEDWVGAHHRLPSPHPRYPLVKYFYFPGFTPESGGLLRENDQPVMVNNHGVSDALRIFLFGYEQPALQNWVRAQQNAVLSIAPCALADQLAELSLELAESCRLEYLPFVPQSAFDEVLRGQDLLFVRGEDSFVRAQWAGKPVFWQIYPQDEAAHIKKLIAFYKRYLNPQILSAPDRENFMRFILAWNASGDTTLCGTLWPKILKLLPTLQLNAQQWREDLLKQPDLVTQLRAFVADLVK